MSRAGPAAGRSRRTTLLAALACLGFAALLFGPSFAPGRLFAPMHTARLEPWRSDLDAARSAQLARGEYHEQSDKLISFRADDQVTLDAWSKGRVPLWNPTNAGGVPHLAQGLYGVFHPFHVLYRLLSPERAWGFLAALNHALAAFFTFLYLRRIGLAPAAALFGGFAFGFSGALLDRAHYYQYVECLAWLPLGLLLIERHFAGGGWLPALALAPVTTLLLLPGWPQPAALVLDAWLIAALARAASLHLETGAQRVVGSLLVTTAAAMAVRPFLDDALKLLAFWPHVALLLLFLSARGKAPFVRSLLPLGAGVLLGGLGAAIQYLPAVEWMAEGTRQVAAPERLSQDGLRAPFLFASVFPDLFGRPGFAFQSALWHLTRLWALPAADVEASVQVGNQVENALYLGLLPLLLLPFGLLRGAPRRGVHAGAAFLFLAFALGARAVVYPAYFLLPGLQISPEPRRALVIAAFFAAALGAAGLDRLLAGRGRGAALSLGALVFVAAGLALALGWRSGDAALAAPAVAHVAELARDLGSSVEPPPEAVAAAGALLRDVLIRFALLGGAAAFVLALLARGAGTVRRAAPAAAAGLAVVLLAADLAHHARPRLATQPAAGFLASHPLIEHLVATVGTDGRLARFTTGQPASLLDVSLAPNLAGVFGLRDAWCYTVSPPRRWFELAERIAPGLAGGVAILAMHRPEHLASRVLDLMAVRAIVGHGAPPEPLPEGVVLDATFGSSYVLKNERALPRAFTVPAAQVVEPGAPLLDRLLADGFDPRAEVLLEAPVAARPGAAAPPPAVVRFVEETPECVRVSLDSGGMGGPGHLVLLDTWAPGWSAEVDGAEAEVLRANHAFRAVPLPAGAREVVLRYQPTGFAIGRAASLAALGAWLVLLFLAVRGRPASATGGDERTRPI